MSIPTVACCVTSYWYPAHADNIVTKLLRGYDLYGTHTPARVKVASLYVDQFPKNDISRSLSEEFGVPIFDTIAEAIGVGQPGVNVDGVILIGEQGEYGFNELGQELYPRRRFFEAAISTMISANKFVPISNDKHLAWNFEDAKFIYDTARRFNVPLVAGSTIPTTWREPALEYPLGVEGLTEAMTIFYGPMESYGFHAIEGLQAMVERRAGGETGVAAITALTGEAVWEAGRNGAWSQDVFDAAWSRQPLSGDIDPVATAVEPVVYLIEYRDGLKASVFLLDGAATKVTFAARRNDEIDSALLFIQDWGPVSQFVFVIRKIESTVINGVPPTPIERTLLTSGLVDYALRSHHQGGIRIETPLDIAYTATESIPDTGIGQPLPVRPEGEPSRAEIYRQKALQGQMDHSSRPKR